MKKKVKLIILIISFIIGLTGIYIYTQKKDTSVQNYDDKGAQFIHDDSSYILNLIKEKKPGIYYFGYSTCDWCIELLPILKNKLEENNQKAYVIDTKDSNFTDDNLEDFKKFYKTYTEHNDFLVPFVLRITEKGEVKVHTGTVKDHYAKLYKMNDDQENQLNQEIQEMLNDEG